MAAEEAGHGHADRLSVLGQVSAPAPEVLAAARERLWAVVAGEMLWDASADKDAGGRGAPRTEVAARRNHAARADGGADQGTRADEVERGGEG